MSEGDYLLANRASEASRRFASLAALFDPVTLRHVDALGIAPGWRCWEVGAGGPSMPDALAMRVGAEGTVVATDLDTRWLAGQVAAQVRVLDHDVAREDPPGGDFDLVHARLVLLHVPERDIALERMVAALRPGGWLLVEDYDISLQPLICPDEATDDQRLANRVKAEFRHLLADRGADPAFGRRLPRMFRDAGLVDVAADAYFPLAMPSVSALERANTQQVRDALVARGQITSADVDRYLALTADADIDLATAPLISTWGRRPG